MAREALKALSRKRLMYTDVPIFFELLSNETPRMAAILAAAGVEDGLEFAIQNQFMRGLSKAEFQTMFDASDMLGTFGSKIKMGHALRLYGDITQADLNCIKDVSVFAHAKMKLDFADPPVIEACNHLQGPFGIGTPDKDHWSPFQRFMKCAEYLYLEFLKYRHPKCPTATLPRASLIGLCPIERGNGDPSVRWRAPVYGSFDIPRNLLSTPAPQAQSEASA
jgi:hypothetical protein